MRLKRLGFEFDVKLLLGSLCVLLVFRFVFVEDNKSVWILKQRLLERLNHAVQHLQKALNVSDRDQISVLCLA